MTLLKVQGHTVPHLKALICGKNEPRWLRCCSSSGVCQVLLKNAVFLRKDGCGYQCTYKYTLKKDQKPFNPKFLDKLLEFHC